jgi:hypothetical protein
VEVTKMSRKIKLQVAVLAALVAGTAVLLAGVDRALEVTNYDQSLYLGTLALVYLASRGVRNLVR